MSDKTELLEKLRRLAAPGSGATDGERKAALAAIERITGKPETPSTVEVPKYSRTEINDLLSQIEQQITLSADEAMKAAQKLANAIEKALSNKKQQTYE